MASVDCQNGIDVSNTEPGNPMLIRGLISR